MSIPQLTIEEEADLILNDVFLDDTTGQAECLSRLAELQGQVCSKMNQSEINDMIIDNEDDLHALYDDYLTTQD